MDYGATKEQIDAVSLEELDAWVADQDELARDTRKPPKAEAKVDPDDEIDWGEDEAGAPLTEKDVAPGIAKNIRKLHERQKQLEKTIKSTEEREKTRAQRAITEAADVAIEALGEKYEKVFGKGEMRDLDPGSKTAKRRTAAFRAAGIDELDSQASIMRKLRKAANELFDDLIQEAPKPKAKAKAAPEDEEGDDDDAPPTNGNGKHFTKKEWAEGATIPPTSRRPKPRDDEDSMRQVVRQWMRDNVKEETEAEVFDGLPE
jgi:hypothetical protein